MIRDAKILENNAPYYTIEFFVDDVKYTQTIISELEDQPLLDFITDYINNYAEQLEELNQL
jgi:hypothetical protein